MNKNMLGGTIVLMVLLGIAGVFLLIEQDTDTEPRLKLGQATKDLLKNPPKQQTAQEVSTADNEQNPLPQGERSGTENSHADGIGHDEPHASHPHSITETETDTFPNLLERDSHWSDAYLSSMEELEVMFADDADAMFVLGKVKTILKHGGLDAHGHNPAVDKAFVELMNFNNDLISSPGTEVSVPRRHELMKLRWPLLDAPPPNVNWNKGWLYENETSLKTKKGE